jgi:hypothetical protein
MHFLNSSDLVAYRRFITVARLRGKMFSEQPLLNACKRLVDTCKEVFHFNSYITFIGIPSTRFVESSKILSQGQLH